MFTYNNWFVAALDIEVTNAKPRASMTSAHAFVMYRSIANQVPVDIGSHHDA